MCDLNIKMGNKMLSVHKIVLVGNSTYFDKLLTGGFKESSVEEITLDSIEPNAIELIIDYIYTLNLRITEDNVQNLLVASSYLLFDDIRDECIKFMKENINVENCSAYKQFACLNEIPELSKSCFSFITDNFCDIVKRRDFLLFSFDDVIQLIQNDHLNAVEKEIYNSILLWVKSDLNNRLDYLPELMKHIKFSKISVFFFINNIENEDILQSSCKSFLYHALKMYTVKSIRNQIECPYYYYNRRNYANNRLILISSKNIGRYNLEWRTTSNEICKATNFFWTSRYSVVLRDGRIFSADYCPVNKVWSVNIFNGTKNEWDSIGHIDFSHNRAFIQVVELNNCVYMQSSGEFISYNLKEKEWNKLNGVGDDCIEDGKLVVLDRLIYNVSTNQVFEYNPNTNVWNMISQFINYPGNLYAICSLNGCLYLMGGENPKGEYLKSVMRFCISTCKWDSIADMNVARSNAGAITVNGLIYVIGGVYCDSIEVYDPKSNTWTLSKLRLESKDHIKTWAFSLNIESSINPENIASYYSDKQ